MRPAAFRSPQLLVVLLLAALSAQATFPRAARAQETEAAWQRLSGPVDPMPAYKPLVVRDAVRHRMVVVDMGAAAWVWTLSLDPGPTQEWHYVRAAGVIPASRYGCSFAVDSLRDRILVFGGYNWPAVYDEVWALSLGDAPEWTRLEVARTPPLQPMPVGRHYAMVSDPLRDRMVFWGGEADTSTGFTDLWALELGDTLAWSVIQPQGTPPSPRRNSSVVYDPWNDRLVCFGGYQDIPNHPCYGSLFDDTWTLSLSGTPTWSRLAVAPGPSARVLADAIVDHATRRMVVHAGRVDDNCTPVRTVKDTWALRLDGPPAWEPVPVTNEIGGSEWPAVIESPERHSMIRYLGSWAACWELSLESLAWSQILPPAPAVFPPRRPFATVLVRPGDDRMLMYGGSCWHDLWSLSLVAPHDWAALEKSGVAPSCGSPTIAYDSRRDRLLSFSGGYATPSRGDSVNHVSELSLDPPRVWTPVAIAGQSPPGRRGFTVTYDPVRDRVLLFGGVEYAHRSDDCGYSQDDVWALWLGDPVRWERLSPTGSPGIRDRHQAVYDPHGDRLVVQGGEIQDIVQSLGCNNRPLWDTWELSLRSDSLVWRLLDAAAPVAGVLAIDSLRDEIALLSSDMEVRVLPLDGSSGWRRLETSGEPPSPRSLAAFGFDPVRDQLLVFGGDSHADAFGLLRLEPLTHHLRARLHGPDELAVPEGPARGLVQVEILGEPAFSVDSVVVASLALSGAPVRMLPGQRSRPRPVDVNRDGLPDLVVAFERGALRLSESDSVATLTGVAAHGTRLVGTVRLARGPRGPSVAAMARPPRPFTLRVAGTLTRGRAIRAWVSLPDDSPARLEAIDVLGRSMLRTELAAPGASDQAIELPGSRALPPGIYLVRLTQGGRSTTARAIVLP